MVNDPGSSMIVSGPMSPLSSAAVAVASLKVDPGAYSPAMARSSSGSWLAGLVRRW